MLMHASIQLRRDLPSTVFLMVTDMIATFFGTEKVSLSELISVTCTKKARYHSSSESALRLGDE
jgi:hypothetical protein